MKRLVLGGWALLAACSGGKAPDNGSAAPAAPDVGIHISTEATSYAPGAKVAISIHNARTSQFAFNPCTRTVEREANAAWSLVTEPNRMCTMEAWLLDPGATRAATIDLPRDISAGRYRIAIDFGAQDSTAAKVHASSTPFTVTKSE
jgi:hypothetical protein